MTQYEFMDTLLEGHQKAIARVRLNDINLLLSILNTDESAQSKCDDIAHFCKYVTEQYKTEAKQ